MKAILVCAAVVLQATAACYAQPASFHAVCVGINDYPGTKDDLDWSVADAEELAYALLNQLGWAGENITLLTDGDATENAILSAIGVMPRSSGYTDLFHYSGHGGYSGLIPVNQTDLTPSELQGAFGATYAQYAVYLDACYAGVFPRDMSKGVVSSACEEDERANEYAGLENGVFSYYLIEGLTGSAAGGADGIVTAEELHTYAASPTTAYDSSMHPQIGDNYSGPLVLDPAPAAPQNVTISGSTGQHPTISWSANGEEDLAGYKVYRKISPDESQYSLVATVSQTSWTDPDVTVRTGGTPGQYAYYYLKAYDAADNLSSASATVYKAVSYNPPKMVNEDSTSTVVSSRQVIVSLEQNYPNPFNPITTIRFGLPERSHVTLIVFNALGQQVAKLVDGELEAGYHEGKFDASNLSSGVYLYQLRAGAYMEMRKLVHVK